MYMQYNGRVQPFGYSVPSKSVYRKSGHSAPILNDRWRSLNVKPFVKLCQAFVTGY